MRKTDTMLFRPLAALALVLWMTAACAAPARVPGARLGINLAGPADWNTELPFSDVFRLSREWISQREGAAWGKGPALALDERGWLKRLEPGCWAETLLCTIEGGHYPAGDYRLLHDGRGTLEAAGAARAVASAPGRMTLRVDPAKGAIFLRLRATDPADPVRNIRVLMPGSERRAPADPFNPSFLARWKGVACLRFMDWMQTNGSPVARWADRPRPDDATFCARGVPLETMIDLANRLRADAWFCMPHRADDDYVRRFVAVVKRRLDPRLTAYVEYSNEVWNAGFEQHRYAEQRARDLGLGPAERPWEGAALFYARRSLRIFDIWREALGPGGRLVRVLAWQAASGPYWTDGMLLGREGVAGRVDALAIAPYVSMIVPARSDDPKELTAAQVRGWTVERLLDHVERAALPESVRWIREQKRVAAKHRLTLIAYEGGQHLVGVGGGENDEALTRLLLAANAHPRMGAIYERYLDAWQREGGGLFCHFSSVSAWSKWGSWGLLQYADDPPARSPKFAAVMGWAHRLGQPVGAP